MKLQDLKQLYDDGWSLIYLREKEKRPVNAGWTKGPRKTWEELKRDFKPNLNLGVRLGESSKIGDGYLCCIDVDIKDPKYKAEALAALQKIIGDDVWPEVWTGSGNGSRHLYGVSQEPFKMIEIEKHKGKWEICAYSNGRQVVMPPSIHPNGKPYRWKVEWCHVGEIPVFDPLLWGTKKVHETIKNNECVSFVAEEVDLYASTLPIDIIKLAVEGEGCNDKSASAHWIAKQMCVHGFTDNQILSVLSDPSHYISEAGLRRRGNQAGAVDWFSKYVLVPARADTDPMRFFRNKPELTPLTREEATLVNAEIEKEGELKDEEIAQKGFYTYGDRGALKPQYGALLRAFVKEHPYRMIADMKAVYVFKDTHYVDCTPIEVKAFSEKKFFPQPEEKIRQEFLAKIQSNHVTRRSFFTESIEEKINFKNGVLMLKESEELRPHSPEFGFRGVLPFEYDPKAQCPFFKEWLFELMLCDKDLTYALQEFMGYIVRGGDYKYHKALWLGGEGRNGKSTMVDILKALIGEGNYSAISIKALMQDKFAGASLDGKIANFSEETSPQELADSGPFKNLTGDGQLFAQKKYGDPYVFRNRAKLIMTYNRIPDLKDLSPGMLSRPMIIPFRKTISEAEQDRDIKQKLLAELPGIFNFAMRGWRRLERQGGFTFSQVSADALQKVKEESCNVYQWVENHILLTKGTESMMASDMYTAYALREKYSYSEREFYRRLKAHPELQERRKRREKGMIYLGIKLM